MPELLPIEISCGIRQLDRLCKNPAVYRKDDKIPPKDVIINAFADAAADEGWLVYEDDDDYDYGEGVPPQKPEQIKFGIIIFSDSVRRGNGKRLAAFIEKEKLGTVVASDVIDNPNTKRNIQMWMWYLDRPALVKWFDKQLGRDKKKKEKKPARRNMALPEPYDVHYWQ